MTRNLVFVATLAASVSALWPQPKQFSAGSSALKISPSFDITLSGITDAPKDLVDAIASTKEALNNDKLERLVVGRGAADEGLVAGGTELAELVVSLEDGAAVRSISEEAVDAIESRQEGYTLAVPEDGSSATLTANSTLGLYRGLTTFQQLWYFVNGTTYTVEAPIQIEDSPAYPYRGLMLDTARNYFPVADIKRTLDAMSLVKINTFHWHVVDSQSFPLQVPGFTELAETGAYASNFVYSPEDVQDIVSYAAARGIDVIAEIDTPGHTSVISKAHPEYIACAEKTPWASFANEPPAGQIRIASDEAVNFTASLIEAASSMFQSKFFSTGGDEVNERCYAEDEETQQALNATGKTLEQTLNEFVQATHEVLHNQDKTAVVWEEMALDHNITLKEDTVILVWISSDHVKAVAERDSSGWVGDFPSGNSWCDPFKTWQKSYSFDPTANLTDTEAQLVLGGLQLLWTEQSGPQNLDSTVWPRAASSAELFWTGPGGNLSEALPRLHDVAYRLRQRGVNAISLQPMWCALRPGACDLTA
ncbi:Glucosamine-6-phosphate isomerase (Glucosamine-6-phosphate deaminase) (GNPDA) (GlcN6P deaminase) [Paramarasmius palmivorus]|uniref:Beta-hexosaminidase n=1 Tax=Paramarasmius palmivorus TaxID=297713 RepID=A0AAW0DRN2_9AGAR